MNEVSPYSSRGTIYIVPDQDDPMAQARGVQEPEDAPGVRDYWQIIRKHKWKIIGCLFAAIIIALIFVLTATPIYTAKAQLVIERKSPQVVNIQQVISESVESDEHNYYQSQYEMLRSRSLAADVIKQLGLDKNAAFAGKTGLGDPLASLWAMVNSWIPSNVRSNSPLDPSGVDSRLIDAYAGALEVEPVKRSRLVNVAVSTPDPSLSANIANAHANAFIRQGLKLRSRANEDAKKFLETKLAELKQRVQNSEEALNRFRRGKGIISLDDKENIVVDRLADLNKRLTEAEGERIGLGSRAGLIERREYDSLPAVITNPLIQNLKSQVVTLEGQQANLEAQFKSGYPRLAQIQAQVEEARQRLSQQIKGVVEGINSAFYAAASKEKELRRQMDKQKSDALALKDVSVLDNAETPLAPSKPQKKLILMMAVVLGLMGGLGWAFLSEHLDDTLRTPEDVERYLRLANLVVVPDFFSVPKNGANWKLPFVGRPPAIDSKLCVPSKSPAPADLRFTVITEAYRKLRTSILYSRPGEPPKTILFTSSTAGEGKTISVANTAIMFAQLGYKCLVIDADLRRPSCHRALRVSNERGLTDFLVGQEALANVIKPTPIANLSVLNCGAVAPNPTELIASKKMRDALDNLKERFDFVFIDSPPVMPVSDAIVLSTMVDGVVYVVRGQETSKSMVKAAISQLKNDHQAKILGVLLNRVDLRSAEYEDYYMHYGDDYYSSVKLA